MQTALDDIATINSEMRDAAQPAPLRASTFLVLHPFEPAFDRLEPVSAVDWPAFMVAAGYPSMHELWQDLHPKPSRVLLDELANRGLQLPVHSRVPAVLSSSIAALAAAMGIKQVTIGFQGQGARHYPVRALLGYAEVLRSQNDVPVWLEFDGVSLQPVDNQPCSKLSIAATDPTWCELVETLFCGYWQD